MTQDLLALAPGMGQGFVSIRSGPMKIESGNLVWRSQGALDAVEIPDPGGVRCADNSVRTEFLREALGKTGAARS